MQGMCICLRPIPLTRAAESMNVKLLRLRLQPENIGSDSNSDSGSTPAQQDAFHPKEEIHDEASFLISILIACI